MNPVDPFPLPPLGASGAYEQVGGSARHRRIRPALVLVGYWVLFLILQRTAALLTPTPAVSVWYFPAALSLALLLALGPAYAPALLVAPFLGNLVLVFRTKGLFLSDVAVNAVAHALGYGLVALAFKRAHLSPRLRHVSDVAGLLLAAAVGPMLVALPAVASLQRGGSLAPLTPFRAFQAFWLGDTLGVLTLAPLLLVWVLPLVRGVRPARWAPWHPERPLEAALQSAALALAALITVELSHAGTLYLKYLLFLPLLWVALRGGLKAVSLAIPFLSVVLVALLLGTGRPPAALLDAQAFLAILFGTALLMGAAVDAQDRALRTQERRSGHLSQLMAGTGAIPWAMDPMTGRVGHLGSQAEALLGWPLATWMEEPFWEAVVHPDDRSAFVRFCRETPQAGPGRQLELRLRQPGGRIRWVRILAGPELGSEGRSVMGFLFDIHARKRAEEDRSLFFQMTRELLVLWDAEGRIRDLNPAWEAQLGYRREDLLGMPLLDGVHPEDREEVLAGQERLSRGEEPVAFEIRFRSREGAYRWLLWSATPLRDQGLAYGVARDITDRKEMELRLRASEAQYRSTLAALEEGVVLRDRGGRLLSSNAAAERILGGEPWLLDGPLDGTRDIIYEDGTPLPVEEWPPVRALRSGVPVPGIVIGFVRQDGRRAWIQVAAQPLVCEGSVTGVVCSLADITQQRADLEALHHSERELRSILDTLPDMIFQMDARGTYLGFRPSSQEEPILPPEAFLGRTIGQILPELAGPTLEAIHRCLEEGQPQSLRYDLPGPTGAPKTYEARIIPHRADEVLAIVRDISEFKQHEKAIQGALEEKEVLLKEIHHRVKNNLQVVSSLLRLQAASHPEPAVRAALQEAQERIQTIALIHQKLKHAPDPTRLDLEAYVRTLAERLVRTYASAPTLVDLQIRVHPVRLGPDEAVPLGLILNELVSNALQHAFPPGEGGSLEIEIEALPGGRALLRIADSGMGLPENVQLDHGGLGFQLVRALADQLGGTLELERRRGAAFRLTFTPHPGPLLTSHEP